MIQRFSNVPNLQGTQIFILMCHPLSRPALNWKGGLALEDQAVRGRNKRKEKRKRVVGNLWQSVI